MFTDQEVVEILKERYKKGLRIKLLRMDDPQAPPKGTLGTCTGVDDAGHILMRWDNGSRLNLIYGEDVFDIVEPNQEEICEQN